METTELRGRVMSDNKELGDRELEFIARTAATVSVMKDVARSRLSKEEKKEKFIKLTEELLRLHSEYQEG